jgi:hypothetical protein
VGSTNLNVSINSAADFLFMDTEKPLAQVLSLLQLLVSMTGPDIGAELLSKHPQIHQLPELIIKAAIKKDVDLQVLLCTLTANIIDRNLTVRSVLAKDTQLVRMLSENCLAKDLTSPYYGMLLGILISQDKELQSTIKSATPNLISSIKDSFDQLLQIFASNGKLDSSLQSQLDAFRLVF